MRTAKEYLENNFKRTRATPDLQKIVDIQMKEPATDEIIFAYTFSSKQIMRILSEYLEKCIREGTPIIGDAEILDETKKSREQSEI